MLATPVIDFLVFTLGLGTDVGTFLQALSALLGDPSAICSNACSPLSAAVRKIGGVLALLRSVVAIVVARGYRLDVGTVWVARSAILVDPRTIYADTLTH